MTLAKAVAEFERGRVVVEGLPTSRCQTGEEYVTICSGGPKAEGESSVGMATEQEAIDRWLAHVKAYAEGKTGAIYWRSQPDLEMYQSRKGPKEWRVYSRFIITDKPALYAHWRYLPQLVPA